MGNSIFGIGSSGLNAAQAGLLTTGHNISNASTPGYSRQQIVQTTNIPQFTGVGYIGQGTQVATVTRIYDQLLSSQVQQAEARGSELDAYYAQIKQIDNLLADPSAGLSSALQDFFGGVNEVAAHPASVPSRQALLSSAETLAANFRSLDQRLTEISDGINSQITGSVAAINSYAQQIARLNENIVLAQSSAGGQPPNDMLDQRDALIADLNREIKATVVKQDDGSYNIFIGNGQALVVGGQPFTLKAVPSPSEAGRTEVAYAAGSSTILLQEANLQGGKLGGYLAFRNETLDSVQNALGRIAIGLAGTFNQQHQLGMDLAGVLGGNFFSLAGPQVNASFTNSGDAAITAAFSDYAALTASDYRLNYDGANYTLTRLSDNAMQTFAGFPQTVDGVTLTLATGSAMPGDSFLIRPTASGARDIGVAVSDPAKIAAAAPVRTAADMTNTGSASISAGSVNGPPPVNGNLQQPVTIRFTSPTTFDVIGAGNPTGVSYTPGADISYNGWTVRISGVPAAGDSFSVGTNSNGVGDGRNALSLSALQTLNTLAGGTTTYQGAYGQLVSQVGNKTRQLEVTSAAQANLVSQAIQAREAVSGVNLDEEAANLLRYQQAYQASGKMMQIASELFATLLELGN